MVTKPRDLARAYTAPIPSAVAPMLIRVGRANGRPAPARLRQHGILVLVAGGRVADEAQDALALTTGEGAYVSDARLPQVGGDATDAGLGSTGRA
jgi:hypothetical protein